MPEDTELELEPEEEYLEEEIIKTEEDSEEQFVVFDENSEDGFACSICQLAFTSSIDLEDHIEAEHETSNYVSEKPEPCYVCDVCDDSFATKGLLKSHLSSVHKADADNFKISGRKYECFICSKRFETPSKLSRHMSVHRDVLDVSEYPKRPPAQLKHECHICNKRVETPSKLQRHLRVHEKRTNSAYGINSHRPLACDSCDLRFWDIVRLERHQIIHTEIFERSKLHHPPGHMFTCVICLEKIPDYDECIAHMKAHREELGDNVQVKCKLCQKSYPKLTNLIRHSRAHTENATHQCAHCDKRMGMGDDLIDHMLRHEGFKPYLCDVAGCGKRFMKQHKLKQHSIIHDNNLFGSKPYKCSQCEKSFSDPEYLKRHILRHTGRKDHKCSLCPMQFAFRAALVQHMSTHKTVRDHSCDTCDSKFSSQHSLRMHQKIHTGEVSQCQGRVEV